MVKKGAKKGSDKYLYLLNKPKAWLIIEKKSKKVVDTYRTRFGAENGLKQVIKRLGCNREDLIVIPNNSKMGMISKSQHGCQDEIEEIKRRNKNETQQDIYTSERR